MLALVACSAEAVAPDGRTDAASKQDFSDEAGLFPPSEWHSATALAALGSGHATLHYLGDITLGKLWVDPLGRGEISVEAQEALLTAPAFKALPQEAVPRDVGHSESLTMVALAFTDADDRSWLRPGFRPGVTLHDLGGSDPPATPTPIVIAGKKKGDGFDSDSDFDTTDYPPESVQRQPDQTDTDTGNADTNNDSDADQWEPTGDSDTTGEPEIEDENDIDDDMEDEIDRMQEDYFEKKKKN